MNRQFEKLTCKEMACVWLKFCSVVLKKSSISVLGALKCLTCSTHVSLTQCSLPEVPQNCLCSKGARILFGLCLLIPVSLIFLALDTSLNYLSQISVLKVLKVTFLALSAPRHLSQTTKLWLRFIIEYKPWHRASLIASSTLFSHTSKHTCVHTQSE